MRVITTFILLALSTTLWAQNHRFYQYRVEQGLPGDVVKSVTEDSFGYIWIATDDGVVKYDGARFTTYKDAVRSPYAKGFLHTSDGRLLVYSDLDLVEIKNRLDTVIFSTVLRGERFITDSTIHYPKSLYEDKNSILWIGEPRSIVRYDGEKLHRYDLGQQNLSPVFVRSFNFFEDDDGNFYAIAFNGAIFRLDKSRDRFIEQKGFRLPDEVSTAVYSQKKLMVATRSGVFGVRIHKGVATEMWPVIEGSSFSNLLVLRDSSIIATTYHNDVLQLHPDKQRTLEKLAFDFSGSNSAFQSKEGDIWVASDKGLVLVQENTFRLADKNSEAHFIEGVAADATGNAIWYASKEELVKLEPGEDDTWKRKVILSDKAHYFLSAQWGENGLWVSSTWTLLHIVDDKLVRTWDFSQDGNFIHDLTIDSKQRVWFSQVGASHIKRISPPEFITEEFPLQLSGVTEISNIKEGKDGMYAVASGAKNFIFFKAHNDSIFRNVSVPMPFEIKGDFNVSHCAVQGDNIWLATTDGLLLLKDNSIVRILGDEEFARLSVSCVEVLDEDDLLFSNSLGLFRYNVATQEFWLYDEHTGLPSNTIPDHGILVAKNGAIWVGTSFGIATANSDIRLSTPTRTPYCVDARINGVPTRYSDGLRVAYGSFISLRFSSISFPEKKILYQWRADDKSKWNIMEQGQLSLSNLPEGRHIIQVRAKKNTGSGWSAPALMSIEVDLPYWKKTEFIFLVVLLVIVISWASYAISAIILSERRKYLQEQVDARTRELKVANDELTLRNTELDRFVYSASHDLSAPLKSILGLIQVAKLDNPGDIHLQYLDMMERSVYKLEDFIQEVVTYSRNTRMPVRFEQFNFRAFVESLLQDHEYSPNFKHIRFIIEDETKGNIVSDVTRMKIILNNLLSNAIKFHWIEKDRDPYVLLRLKQADTEYILEVRDNGRGIKEEHLHRIFEMFYRATDETQGSGLGLYILKETVTKLGGTVTATSAIDEGTAFFIHLPLPPQA